MSMGSEPLLDVALHAARLKLTPRTGWQMRGAPLGGQPENVAAHSWGVVFLTMLLADLDEREVNREQALRLAVLHDLAESLVGDWPAVSARFLPGDVKHAAERAAMREIVGAMAQGAEYMRLWEQYNAAATPEAQLVKDADKLDMMIQAYLYEQAGQRNLQEFWDNMSPERFHTPAARTIFVELLGRRNELFA